MVVHIAKCVCVCSMNLLERHFWNEENWSTKYIGVVPRDPELTEVHVSKGKEVGVVSKVTFAPWCSCMRLARLPVSSS